MDIDLVITYVDSSDPIWRQTYNETSRKHNKLPVCDSSRFREWNTLKYIMRGTQMYMPWIRKIHLIVERPSQVPNWVRKDNVNIVYHPFIIPGEYLPTYNSTCIEQFMWRISGLSEHFLYANDDMIPVNPLKPSDFFDDDGNPKIEINERLFTEESGMYAHHLHNGESLVRKMLNMQKRELGITRTGHNIAPMLKSTWAYLWDNLVIEIKQSLTTFRDYRNINQELAAYWHLLTENYTLSSRTSTYTEMDDIDKVCNIIKGTKSQLICINDAKSNSYQDAKRKMTVAFEIKMPEKSKYEL